MAVSAMGGGRGLGSMANFYNQPVGIFVFGSTPIRTGKDKRLALLAQKEEIAKKLLAIDNKLKSEQRLKESRLHTIVGMAVIAQAKSDAGFAKMRVDILGKSVTKKQDKSAIAGRLAQWPSPTPQKAVA